MERSIKVTHNISDIIETTLNNGLPVGIFDCNHGKYGGLLISTHPSIKIYIERDINGLPDIYRIHENSKEERDFWNYEDFKTEFLAAIKRSEE